MLALHLTILVYIVLVELINSIYDLPLPSAPVLSFPNEWKTSSVTKTSVRTVTAHFTSAYH